MTIDTHKELISGINITGTTNKAHTSNPAFLEKDTVLPKLINLDDI